MIFESHAHYDDEAFQEDREQLLKSFASNGIGYVINVASDLDSVKSSLKLAECYPFVYAALGFHPSDVGQLNEDRFEWLSAQLQNPKAVAVGETGLDYYWDKDDDVRARQKEWFARQLDLAKDIGKPVVIHSRDAAKDTLDVLAAQGAKDMKGVVHCFSYTKETAARFLDWDFYIGIGGVVTFKNAKKLKEAVEYIPLNRILLETDSPYLSPEPNRGRRNSSLNLPYIAQAVADIRGIDYEEVTEVCCDNAKRLFGIR